MAASPSSASRSTAIIRQVFSFNGETVHVYEGASHPGKNSEYRKLRHPESDQVAHYFSGKHDHGPLPELHIKGPYAQLLKGLKEAKRDSDIFLTEMIRRQGGETNNTLDEEEMMEDVAEDDDDGEEQETLQKNSLHKSKKPRRAET